MGSCELLKKNGPMDKEDLFHTACRKSSTTAPSDQKERYYYEDAIVKDETLSINLNDNVKWYTRRKKTKQKIQRDKLSPGFFRFPTKKALESNDRVSQR
jgi:hypothetical protein